MYLFICKVFRSCNKFWEKVSVILQKCWPVKREENNSFKRFCKITWFLSLKKILSNACKLQLSYFLFLIFQDIFRHM
jgi:hypothetical protein